MTREEALSLMHEYTESEALRRHMYAVEIAMRAYAEKDGADADAWGTVGLLHDFDYERFPNDKPFSYRRTPVKWCPNSSRQRCTRGVVHSHPGPCRVLRCGQGDPACEDTLRGG